MTGAPIRLSPAQTLAVTASSGGELTVAGGDAAARVLRAGDVQDVPPRTPHRMGNAGTQPCTATWIITAALRTEEMFRAIAAGRSRIGIAARLLTGFRAEYRFGSPRRS